ncbi:hypothetical protein [Krasilnikovia sp. MM14-A1259]|uniref:Rv0361 family membrane protein n=1 Tax=Krasilnikovia sp. MM14-A1259 TaxID=3373539 RepID=UPI003822BDE8
MTQEPRDDSAAQDAHPGHPEPAPPPLPEPEPPQPIPLPEPVPPPQPPHPASIPTDDTTTVLTPEPPTWPPRGPGRPPTVSIAAAEAAAGEPGPAAPPSGATGAVPASPPPAARPADGADFIDALPARSQREWPPLGAFPGEPGNPDSPTGIIAGAAGTGADEPTSTSPIAPDADVTEQFQPVSQQQTVAWQQPPAPGQAPPFEPGAEEQPTELIGTGVPGHRRSRRTGLWVSAALVLTLAFCGGGAVSAYLLLRNADRAKGAPDPATAVDRFLTAVYTEQNASTADGLVCREARNSKRLAARVEQIKGYSAQYASPTFTWSEPAIAAHNDELATVSVQLTMSTADEKTAQQGLTFTVVHKTGWLVCDVRG